MSNTRVFLSHISEEAALARLFRDRLAGSFLGMIDVFVSSDSDSLHLGERWVDRITEELRTCAVMLILCSERSVGRPWINFEAGAGWIRDVPVVPICHTGMDKNNLPLPLKLLQGINANQQAELRSLYTRIAKALGSTVPAHDFGEFAARVVDFEREYGFTQHVRQHVNGIIEVTPRIAPLFAPRSSITKFDGQIDQRLLDQLTPHLNWLQAQGLLDYSIGPSSGIVFAGAATGIMLDLKLAVLTPYYDIAHQIRA